MDSDKILRAKWHDYTQRAIYLITLRKSPNVENFGELCGDYRLPAGSPGSAFIRASRTGKALKDALRDFRRLEPKAQVLQYALMPDHLHIILFITEKTDDILGRIIARYKVAVDHLLGSTGIFTKGFNDQFLKTSRSLDTLYQYLRDNPRRLAVRRAHPEFFRRVNRLQIAGKEYHAYGNTQLLNCPFKEQVIVHRADSKATRLHNRDIWLYTAANGGVLVSPFISPAEKEIRAEAEKAGSRFILITADPMAERYKPTGREFALCEEGRMLIISAPATPTPGASASGLSRAHCLQMNELARQLASPPAPPSRLHP
ncbi:MAG: hypothetical protein SO168_03850 [Muribaculaceae bacterium]|nr:hypothetical protein [Muribaculaceae bacterium]